MYNVLVLDSFTWIYKTKNKKNPFHLGRKFYDINHNCF